MYQQALILTEIEGLKQTDLAEKLGISISGAKLTCRNTAAPYSVRLYWNAAILSLICEVA